MELVKWQNSSVPSITDLLDGFLNNNSFDWIGGKQLVGTPAANIKEQTDRYEILLAMPGFNKSNINVELGANDLISVTASNDVELEDTSRTMLRQEFTRYPIHRTFQAPSDSDLEKISASYENGVLSIVIPKHESQLQSKRIEVT